MLGALFFESTQKYSDNEALNILGQSFSYSELCNRALDLSKEPEFSAKPYCLIAGSGDLSDFVQIIACWMSNKPYTPLNPKFSTTRVGHIVSQLSKLDWEHFPDLAHIIFTSGTTGMPKGVPINSDQLARYIRGFNLIVTTTPSDRVMLSYDLSFDAAYLPILSAWSNGASLCVIPSSQVLMATRYVQDIGISVWHSVPSVAAMSYKAGLLALDSLPSLKHAIFGGEALSLELVRQFQSAAPLCQVTNAYGPTEATIAASYYQIQPSDLVANSGRGTFPSPVPLGKPYDDVYLKTYRVDSNIPTDGVGELCIGGKQVTSGYIDSNLNKNVFFEDGSLRWYRTGDLAIWHEPYGYCYKGRIDRQIKFKGYRIELQDIESALRAASKSDLVCAVPFPILEDGTIEGLVGVVSRSSSSNVNSDQIIGSLIDILPSYMIPSSVLMIDEMPLSINGKVDFKAVQNWVQDNLT